MRRPYSYAVGNRISLVALAAWSWLGGVPAGVAAGADSEMVAEMLQGRQQEVPVRYLTIAYGPMTLDRAYAIQAQLDVALEGMLGPVVGYKVAYASRAAQEQFGVSEPARGSFFAIQRIPPGSKLVADSFLEGLIETEVAFTLGETIDQPVETVAALREKVRYLRVAFDLGDFRFVTEGPAGAVQDMVASGTGAHYFVLGPAVDPAGVDLAEARLGLVRNGKLIRESPAREVMGSPWNSLLWLVNDVIKRGRTLRAGEVILTGTAAKAHRAAGSELQGVYVGECDGLGQVTVTIE